MMEIEHKDKDIFGNKNDAIPVLDAIVCVICSCRKLLLSCVVNTELHTICIRIAVTLYLDVLLFL